MFYKYLICFVTCSTLFVALDCCNATTNALKPCLSGFNRTTTIQDKKIPKKPNFTDFFWKLQVNCLKHIYTTLAYLTVALFWFFIEGVFK